MDDFFARVVYHFQIWSTTMALTKKEHVRRLLNKQIDMSAHDVQQTLANEGIDVTPGAIYTIRSEMKKAQNPENNSKMNRKPSITSTPGFKPIRKHVLELLEKKEMPFDQLVKGIVAAGYKSSSPDFADMARKKLKLMLDAGEIVKDGVGNYRLTKNEPAPAPSPPAPVSDGLATLLEVAQLCKKVGGIDRMRAYLEILEQVR